jgi:hypothetical protein
MKKRKHINLIGAGGGVGKMGRIKGQKRKRKEAGSIKPGGGRRP